MSPNEEAFLATTGEDGVFKLVRQLWVHRFLFDDGGIIDVIAIKEDPLLREVATAWYQRLPDVKPTVALVGVALVERWTDENHPNPLIE